MVYANFDLIFTQPRLSVVLPSDGAPQGKSIIPLILSLIAFSMGNQFHAADSNQDDGNQPQKQIAPKWQVEIPK